MDDKPLPMHHPKLTSTSFIPPPPPLPHPTLSCFYFLQKDAQPPYFFLCAAQAAIEHRKAAQAAAEARGGKSPGVLEATPVAGKFLGQMALLDSQRRLTDDEFCVYLEVRGLSATWVHGLKGMGRGRLTRYDDLRRLFLSTTSTEPIF
jgi:hypothetical protein